MRRLRPTSLVVAAAAAGAVVLAACGTDPATPVSPTLTASSTPVSSSSDMSSTGSSSIPNTLPAPYIAGADWVQTDVGASLQIRPTANGRRVVGVTAGEEAWREVLAIAPDGDTPGMKAQFDCHWTFARIVQPEKPSWNLEPSRPVVSEAEMISSRCNPGAKEEAN
ncbi:Protein of unknown function [Gordonia malaquae]|uniref:DUF2599 domain-containing protein n=1 Tax=Gordonia malaquae NBRC 108250 TaxID=1223542 RepID=M3TCI9_GORML|nr:DUF2599 domain-containing protein [Gordonia malaquae]GAC79141.1 hypothetical protein GM1_007_01000 [Gordonia malaquae NBRC 108250]SEE08110.1 Protein of unknown function [Gordonia malaquae]